MPHFHHHPDNIIYLRLSQNEVYADSVEHFVIDSGLPYEGLPENCLERYYDPQGLHKLITNDYAQIGDVHPWPAGDTYLANYTQIKAAQQARQEAERQSLNN